jgi:hypothetical protein
MLNIQSAVANERIAELRRAADHDRDVRAALSAHEDPVRVRSRRRARRWSRRLSDAVSITSAAR